MKNHFIEIGHSRIIEISNQARLECDISIDGEKKTVFFAVDKKYKDCLSIKRADPFLALMINFASRTGRDISCLEPVDEFLMYSLKNQYLKTLSFADSSFKFIQITAETTALRYINKNKVGAAMSFDCDTLYTFYKHYHDSEYQITHLCVFNNGVFPKDSDFFNQCEMVSRYVVEKNLEFVYVDSNIHKILPECFEDVCSQRNLACALSLQGLFSTYLYSSGFEDCSFTIDKNNAAGYDMLTTEAFSTASLTFILSGSEATKVEKLKALNKNNT